MNRNVATTVRISIISLFAVAIAAYTLFQAHKLIVGPVVTITSPQNGAVFNSPLIEIDGSVQNVAYLKLNGRPIYTDEEGKFSEKLLLSPGYTILTLDAQDKFGKSVSKKLELILKEY